MPYNLINYGYRNSPAPIANRFGIGAFAVPFALGFLTAPLLIKPGNYQYPNYQNPYNYYNQYNYYPNYY